MRSIGYVGAVSAAMAACIAASPAMAAKPISEATDNALQITYFDEQAVRQILQPIEIDFEIRKRSGGRSYVQASISNILVNMYFTACPQNSKRCLGLYMVSYWNAPESRNRRDLFDSAADFNRRYDFVKSGLTLKGNPFVARYVIADYGVSRGNVRSEISNFVTLASAFRDEVINP